MFECYWVCNELFSIPLIPSESKLIGTPLFIVVTSNSEILILLLLYYSQSFGYILIKEVKNDCAHKHVRVHESARGSNRAKFWIGLLACLCVFLIQWHILWRIETLAATSMILLVKFVASYLKFHKSSCFSIESVLHRLTRVVIDDACAEDQNEGQRHHSQEHHKHQEGPNAGHLWDDLATDHVAHWRDDGLRHHLLRLQRYVQSRRNACRVETWPRSTWESAGVVGERRFWCVQTLSELQHYPGYDESCEDHLSTLPKERHPLLQKENPKLLRAAVGCWTGCEVPHEAKEGGSWRNQAGKYS